MEKRIRVTLEYTYITDAGGIMSTLLIDELYSGIIPTQKFRTDKSFQLAHVRPWIYKHGNGMSGDLTCRIKIGSELLKEVTIDSVTLNNTINGTYFHGYVRFDFNSLWISHNRVNEYTEYTVEYEFVGTSDPNNFYGMCRQYNNLLYPAYGDLNMAGEPKNSSISPYGYELYSVEY